MEKVIVIIVILVLVFVIYFLCVGGKKGKNGETEENRQPSKPAAPDPAPQSAEPEFEDIGTRIVSKLCMEQLDKTGRVVKTFDINEIPDIGVTVSRPGAKQGDVILSELGGEDAMTVGTEGIVIGEDEKGIFGKVFENGHEKNKVYLYDPVVNKSREVTQFDITNNTMVCVGRQWLRFVLPTVPGAPVPVSGMAANNAFLRAGGAQEAQARQGIYRDPRQPSAPHTRQVPQAYAQQMQQARQASQPYGQQAQPDYRPEAQKPVKPVAPSGFSFESSMDDNGRFVITKK